MARRRFDSGTLALTPARMMALVIGPSPHGAQDSDETLETLWWTHRARIMATQHPDAPMPWAWQRFESGVPTERPVLTRIDPDLDLPPRRNDD